MKYLLNFLLLFLFLIHGSSAQTPMELKSWLPEIDGWIISDKIEVFSPENLFDRINGSAPLFIENNFREMTSMEYTKGDSYITIQAYRHARPEDAFGMYASERSSDLKNFNIGGEAQGDETNIYFFAGNMYVKIWSTSADNEGNVLETIANGFAHKIDPDAKYPEVVLAFPETGKIPYTEAFITSNYIGHEFLKNVYTANYQIDNQSFQAFVIDANNMDNAKETLAQYIAFTKQSLPLDKGEIIIKDRYNGDIPMLWKGQYIMGIFQENGNLIPNATNFLNQVSNKLQD